MKEVKSTCCYCGVGCGIIITADKGKIVAVRGDPDHPANYGRLCTKGSNLHRSAATDTRLLFPELRLERESSRQKLDWDEALDYAAGRFAGIIREHGPDSVAFYVSGQLLTEDYYIFNKLAKGLIGTNNIDTNSRLCMSSAVTGYKKTLGADAPPACYEDIERARCIFIAGSNTAYAHPILFRRIEAARQANPGLKIIVVDPRRTDTASVADLHLPILPGTDVALFNAMLHVLLWEGLADMDYIRAHTDGFDALKDTVREYTPESAADICGVPAKDIIQAARWFGGSGASLSLYCQGLNQSSHGTDKNAGLINLHLATGQIGKPGAGPFSLTGQMNAMGGREVGGMANLLPAHRDMANPAHREEVARLWGVNQIPSQPGKTAVELFEALRQGEIKAVWIVCTNPALSMPDQGRVREALEKAEFVILQEAYRHTETSPYADLLLPAASWGEKEGTVTNSERCITRLQPARIPPGEARPDWEIATDFARRLGSKLRHPSWQALFPYASAEAVFNEHRESTRGRDLDITGLSYRLLGEQGPQQWPFREGESGGQVRLYADGVFPTPTGKAGFMNVRYQKVAEMTDASYPFHFNTGRLRDQWHGMTRTGTVARLFSHAEEPVLSMNAEDMRLRGIQDGDVAQVSSRRGACTVRVQSSPEMQPSQVFMPMHWGSRFMSTSGANALTTPAFDPVSFQPELKHAAVKIEKLPYRWQMVALRKNGALAMLPRVQALLPGFQHASLGLSGQDEPVLVLRVAGDAPLDPILIERLDRLMGLDDPDATLRYDDARRGISKRILVDHGMVVGARLSGETMARDWLKEMMASGLPIEQIRLWALAPVNTAPAGSVARGKIVCNCNNVSEREIFDAIGKGSDLAFLQSGLRCGTECGSCLPELKRMLARGNRFSQMPMTKTL
ncbi:MAG: molybdopterin-dependent oxidoreductase [Sulfuricella denitrificans]|nr:molybdopterin-dependent oxidoreductase [Sulfuricella denitrificans]